MLKYLIPALFVVFLISVDATFAQTGREASIVLETEASYLMEINGSKGKAKALALFEAKKNAVYVAAKYLSGRGFIEAFGLNIAEIYNLAARGVQAEIIDEKWESVDKACRYHLHIRAEVRDSDLIKAEILSAKLEKEDSNESFKEEMEQKISGIIDPGKEIAKAYRLLRIKEWRMAIIYLDHLKKKYPNWSDIYMAKAIAYHAIREPYRMKEDLEKACHLGNSKACEDLKSLKRVHDIKITP